MKKKENDLQIQQNNIYHTNIIVMKHIIEVAEKNRENGRLLIIKNVNKTVLSKVAKILSIIDFGNMYSQAISNTNIDTTPNLGLTNIKKYQRYVG